MVGRSANYAIVAVLTLMTAVGGHWMVSRAPSEKSSADLDSLPLKVGSWKGKDLELSKEVRSALNADSILSRAYADSNTGQELGMLIVYRKYGRRDFAHRPELCYPAAGWEITGKTYTKMFYNGKAIDARLVTAEKDIGREVIAYWFASGDRTEANFAKQQLWMALDRMQDRRYGWAFIRINVPVLYSDEEALEAARSFLKEMDKPLMKALTGQ